MALLKTGFTGSANATVGGGASANRAAAAGPGKGTGPGGWEPTALYMIGLIILEIIIVGFLSRHLLK